MEQEAATLDAYTVWRHSRTLADVLRECMARGDRVELQVHAYRCTGAVIDVDGDLVSVRDTNRPRVDLRFAAGVPMLVRVLEAAWVRGRAVGGTEGGFSGRLHAREAAGDVVHVFVAGTTEPLVGRVAPARDALVVRALDGAETYCSLAAVVAITTAPTDD